MSAIDDDVHLDVGACDAAWHEVEAAKKKAEAAKKKEEAAKKKAEAAQMVRAAVFRKRRYRFCAPERRKALEERDACAAQRKRVALKKQQEADAAKTRERERAEKERERVEKEREASSVPYFPAFNDECWNDFYIRAAGIVCRRLKNAKPGLALLVWMSDTHFFSLRVFTDCPDMNGFFSETWSVKQKRVTNVVRFWDMRKDQRNGLNDIFGKVLDHFNWATRRTDNEKRAAAAVNESGAQEAETEPRKVFATISQRVVRNSFAHCEVNEISFR